jgi:hypothetical protein
MVLRHASVSRSIHSTNRLTQPLKTDQFSMKLSIAENPPAIATAAETVSKPRNNFSNIVSFSSGIQMFVRSSTPRPDWTLGVTCATGNQSAPARRPICATGCSPATPGHPVKIRVTLKLTVIVFVLIFLQSSLNCFCPHYPAGGRFVSKKFERFTNDCTSTHNNRKNLECPNEFSGPSASALWNGFGRDK